MKQESKSFLSRFFSKKRPAGGGAKPDNHKITETRISDLASNFARQCHIMTLGVCSEKGAWTSAVYYIHYNKGFWFFSSETSRHIKDAEKKSGNAAAEIHTDSFDWSEIKGLQMTGRIKRAELSPDSAKAFREYMIKFGFVKKMKGVVPGSPEELETLFRVRWYVFVPDEVYFLDNSLGYGFREKVCL